MDVIGGILAIIDGISDVVEIVTNIFGEVKETAQEITDVFVQGGTEVIGFADAIAEPVNITKDFLGIIFPGDFVIMIGIGLTIVIALATRRSTNA